MLLDRLGSGVRGGGCRAGLALSFLMGLVLLELRPRERSRKSMPPSEKVRNILAMLSPAGDGLGSKFGLR